MTEKNIYKKYGFRLRTFHKKSPWMKRRPATLEASALSPVANTNETLMIPDDLAPKKIRIPITKFGSRTYIYIGISRMDQIAHIIIAYYSN
jgi:hypothetical protein